MQQLFGEIADILADVLINRSFYFMMQRSRFSAIMAKDTCSYNREITTRIQ